jgi:hypothetical protein
MNPRGLRADSRGLFCRASMGSTSACPARLDYGMKRELCQDVTFMPLPEGFVQTAFHAMVVIACSVARIDAVLEPDEASPTFLHGVVSPPPGCSSRRYHVRRHGMSVTCPS